MKKLINFLLAFKRVGVLETEVLMLREELELTKVKLQQAKLKLSERKASKLS